MSAAVVDVVLPCLDEARALPWVLARMPPGFRAIVVDNGSTDGSADLAASLGATVVHAPQRGYGAACHAGLLAASSDVVCFMDCDASLDPGQLPEVAAPLWTGQADLVVGRRRPTNRRAWPAHAKAANWLLANRIRARTGWQIRDLGPMRALARLPLLDLGVADRRFGYPLETVLRAAASGWRYVEVPVEYHPRVGASKVTGTVLGVLRTVRDMRQVFNG